MHCTTERQASMRPASGRSPRDIGSTASNAPSCCVQRGSRRSDAHQPKHRLSRRLINFIRWQLRPQNRTRRDLGGRRKSKSGDKTNSVSIAQHARRFIRNGGAAYSNCLPHGFSAESCIRRDTQIEFIEEFFTSADVSHLRDDFSIGEKTIEFLRRRWDGTEAE